MSINDTGLNWCISGRKSQFYIFTAILLCGLALGILIPISAVAAPTRAFENMWGNYNYESKKVINSALFEDKNMTMRLEEFSDDFISYSSKKDSSFGFVYILADDMISIGNHLEEDINITVTGGNLFVGKGQLAMINRTDSISVLSGKDVYGFNFDNNRIGLKILFKTKKGDDVKIHIEDD